MKPVKKRVSAVRKAVVDPNGPYTHRVEKDRTKYDRKKSKTWKNFKESFGIIAEAYCGCGDDCGKEICEACGKKHKKTTVSEAKNTISVTLQKSKSGSTYKAVVSGSVGNIGIEGESTQYLHGVDDLDSVLVSKILRSKIHRSDGYGKAVPTGAMRKIEAAVLAKLQTIKESTNLDIQSQEQWLEESENKEDWIKIFEGLKKGDKFSLKWRSVMGSSPKEPVTMVALRKSYSKKYNVTKWAIQSETDTRKWNKFGGYSLYQRGEGKSISMSSGDTGIMLESMSKVAG